MGKRLCLLLTGLMLFFIFAAQAEEQPGGALAIYGFEEEAAIQAFRLENPQMQLMSCDSPAQGDVLIASALWELNEWIDQGLLADLSGHEGVRTFVESCTPQVRAQVTREGKIYALPLSLDGWCLAYDPQVLSAMGIKAEELPRTWEELFAFLTRWNRQWPQADYVPLHPYGIRSSLLYSLTSAYEDRYLASGETLTFDTPLFARLVKGLMDMDLSNLQVDDPAAAQGEDLLHKQPLFVEYSFCDLMTQPHLVPWPLSLEGSEDSSVGAHLRCAAIAKEASPAAYELLAAYLNAMEPGQQALLRPSSTEPAPDPLWEEKRAEKQQRLADLKQQQEDFDLDLSHEIAEYEYWLAQAEDHRYIVSPQRLADYQRDLIPRLMLRTARSPLDASRDDVTGFFRLQQRFLEGELSPSQFIRNMEHKLREAMK